jgi:hypothetical protein
VACSLIRQVNAAGPVIEHWTFGGGTAMMIQVQHRESHDVDIFLPDPQLLSFLDPAKHDFAFEVVPSAYTGDGARFLKLSFGESGEIDFVVASTLTSEPTVSMTIEREAVLLETVPEIITKKIYHRGATITPRDIFDIAVAGETCADAIIGALRHHKNKVVVAIGAIEKLNPVFVAHAISELAIKPGFQAVAKTANERAKEVLRAI